MVDLVALFSQQSKVINRFSSIQELERGSPILCFSPACNYGETIIPDTHSLFLYGGQCGVPFMHPNGKHAIYVMTDGSAYFMDPSKKGKRHELNVMWSGKRESIRKVMRESLDSPELAVIDLRLNNYWDERGNNTDIEIEIDEICLGSQEVVDQMTQRWIRYMQKINQPDLRLVD